MECRRVSDICCWIAFQKWLKLFILLLAGWEYWFHPVFTSLTLQVLESSRSGWGESCAQREDKNCSPFWGRVSWEGRDSCQGGRNQHMCIIKKQNQKFVLTMLEERLFFYSLYRKINSLSHGKVNKDYRIRNGGN